MSGPNGETRQKAGKTTAPGKAGEGIFRVERAPEQRQAGFELAPEEPGRLRRLVAGAGFAQPRTDEGPEFRKKNVKAQSADQPIPGGGASSVQLWWKEGWLSAFKAPRAAIARGRTNLPEWT
jgi:hypothetical protein